jgi:hypothetical protein
MSSKLPLRFDSWNLFLEIVSIEEDIQRLRVDRMRSVLEEADTLQWLARLQNSDRGLILHLGLSAGFIDLLCRSTVRLWQDMKGKSCEHKNMIMQPALLDFDKIRSVGHYVLMTWSYYVHFMSPVNVCNILSLMCSNRLLAYHVTRTMQHLPLPSGREHASFGELLQSLCGRKHVYSVAALADQYDLAEELDWIDFRDCDGQCVQWVHDGWICFKMHPGQNPSTTKPTRHRSSFYYDYVFGFEEFDRKVCLAFNLRWCRYSSLSALIAAWDWTGEPNRVPAQVPSDRIVTGLPLTAIGGTFHDIEYSHCPEQLCDVSSCDMIVNSMSDDGIPDSRMPDSDLECLLAVLNEGWPV